MVARIPFYFTLRTKDTQSPSAALRGLEYPIPFRYAPGTVVPNIQYPIPNI